MAKPHVIRHNETITLSFPTVGMGLGGGLALSDVDTCFRGV